MQKQLSLFLLILIGLIVAGGISTKAKKYPANYNFILSGTLDSNFRCPPDSAALFVSKSQRMIDSLNAHDIRTKAWASAEDNSTLAAAHDSTKTVLDSAVNYTDGFYNLIPGLNLFNYQTMIISGKYINNNNGTIYDDATSAVTTLIACLPNTTYIHSGSLNNMTNITKRYFNAAGDSIGWNNTSFTIRSWTTPADCYYFQMTIAIVDATPTYTDIQIELGDVPSTYQNYANDYELKNTVYPHYLKNSLIKAQADNDSAVVSRKYITDNFESKTAGITLVTSGDTLLLRTSYNAEFDLLQHLDLPRTQVWGDNKTFNFRNTWIIPIANTNGSNANIFANAKLLHNASDDICPRQYNSQYMGANHGLPHGINITSALHGKTVLDIGSRWAASDSMLYYIVAIPDVNHIWVVSENTGASQNKWAFDAAIPGTHLYHYSKATSTGNIAVTSQAGSNQIEPVSMPLVQKAYLNDVEITSRNWTIYTGRDFKIVEDYYIANPVASIDSLYAHAGSATQTLFNRGIPDHRILNTYQFDEYGNCVVFGSTYNYYEINETSYGFIQAGAMSTYHYDSLYTYIPKTKPIVVGARTWDFNKLENINTAPTGNVLFTTTYYETAGQPPNRQINFLGNRKDSIIASFQFGYDNSIGSAIDATRAAHATYPWYIAPTRKAYPHVIDYKVNPTPALTFNTVVSYRGYSYPKRYSENATNIQFFQITKGKYRLIIDYHKTVSFDKITLPDFLRGYYIEQSDKHANFTMHSKYVQDNGIFVSVVSAYGWGVFDLYERKP